MKRSNAYIRPVEEVEDDLDNIIEPTKSELMFDNYDEVEYTSPYQYDDNDLFDVGGTFEIGGIFDDR